MQSESGPQGTQVFEDWLQIGAVGVVQSLLLTQTTHVPFIKVVVAVVTQTGLFGSFVAHALESAHAWQVPVEVLQMGAWEVALQSLFARQPTHVPFSKVAVAIVTQTGLVGSFVAHALESAHAWQVPVEVLQMGAWGVLQSLFARQPTHIPASEPASPGTQTGEPPSGLPQAPIVALLQARQLPASTSQMGVFPVHVELGQAKGVPPVPLAPAAPPNPPTPPRPPTPPSTSHRLFLRLQCPVLQSLD